MSSGQKTVGLWVSHRNYNIVVLNGLLALVFFFFKLRRVLVRCSVAMRREWENYRRRWKKKMVIHIKYLQYVSITGYAAEIPGHPRHSMVIDSGSGVYNLLVRNVTITDDALYECQVSPGPVAGSKGIRSTARLTVLSEYRRGVDVVLSFTHPIISEWKYLLGRLAKLNSSVVNYSGSY